MTDIIGHVFAPLPILTVALGAGLIALLQTGTGAAGKAFAALGPLFSARPDEERDTSRALLFKVEAVAELKGLAHTDRLRAAHPFCRQALVTLANAADVEHFAAWIGQALDDRRARHGRVIAFWNALADAAPVMGMAGTIIGLIGMFASMRDPAAIGPSMALALMTTLHGMILANVIAGPIANRLQGLSEREMAWQQSFADRVVAIARREPAMLRRSIIQEVA
jgi:chemotaxis protein MotA